MFTRRIMTTHILKGLIYSQVNCPRLISHQPTLISPRTHLYGYNPYDAMNHGDQRVSFNLKSSQMSSSALSDSFEYLCDGSMTIINMFILTVRESTLDVRI